METFVASMNNSPPIRPPPMTLEIAHVSSPGRARASATSSLTVFTGSDG